MSESGRPARESLGTTATGPSGTSWVSVGASPRDPLATASFVAFLLLAATISGPIAPMGIATALCGVLTLLRFARSPRPVWPRTPVDRAALAWLAALVLVSAFALDPVGSFPRVSKGLMPALVGLAALHAGPRTDGRRALAVYLAAAGLVAAAGLGMWVAEGASYAWRARGLSHHYMTFGGQLLLELPVALAVALTARSARWRWGAGAVALLTFASLATTFTRSAWMGAFVSGLVVLAGVWPWGLAFLAGGALAAWFGAQGEWRDRLHSMVDPSAGYNGERLLMWGAGWRMFKADALTGVGLQDLHAVYPMYRSPLATEEIGHLHNTYVQIAATMGLAGLAAFAWLYASLMRAASAGLAWGRGLPARIRAEGEGAGLRLGVTAALVGFLVAGLFEWNFGDEELLYHLYVLVGLAWASRGWARPEDGRPRLAPIDRTTCDRPDRGERSGEVVGRENVLERRTQRAWSHALLVGDRARRALRAPSIVRKVTALADLDGRIESPCIPALIPKTLNGSSSCSPRATERPAGNPERSFQDPGWFTVYEEFALRSRTAGL